MQDANNQPACRLQSTDTPVNPYATKDYRDHKTLMPVA